MAIYCFQCPCGEALEATTRTPEPHCEAGEPVRNYRREFQSHTFAIPSYMQSKVSVSASDVLSSQKDFEAPGDSDGSKGFKKYKDSIKPVKNGTWV